MKRIDNKLYMEAKDFAEINVSKSSLDQAKARKSKTMVIIDDPEDLRKILVEYEKLSIKYKEKFIERFGNPYNHIARQPILEMVKVDTQAEAFFLDYRYSGNKTLPIEHINKYTKAASWLNMLTEVTADKKALKKLLNLSIDSFYLHILELIKIENIDLPTSYRRLSEKRREYEENSYASLISWRFGNNLAAKVNDEKSESVLLEMLQHPNQYDDVFICQQYNIWAEANGYKTIDAPTVGVHRRKNEHLIIMNREGNSALNEKFLKQVKGMRPSAPLYMVESDDNHLDLYFIDPNDDSQSKYYHKYKAIVVVDSYNDYVLGYAYSEKLTTDLVRSAYLNAMYHIRSIAGGWYLPHEVKTDRWGIKDLTPYYEGLGKFVLPSLGNKHRGYIEQFFGSHHWKRCLKAGANNYSGNNITARNRGVNQEVLAQNKKDYPLIGNESIAQVEQFFHRLRHMPQTNGISKHQQWLEAWNKVSEDKKRIITDEQFLLKLGIEHNHRGNGIQITNRGVEPQINGTNYSYDLQEYDMAHIGKSVSIMYDPYDMSRVLVTDFDKIRIIARDARLQPRALEDGFTDSRTYLNSILNEKYDQVELVAAASERRKKVLSDSYLNAEAILQAGVVVKELKQEAEQRALPAMINKTDADEFNVFDQI